MSLFGFDDDLGFMGNHMNAMNMQMRSMNRLMNSLMPDPFSMLAPFDPGFQQNAIMERVPTGPPAMGGLFGFPAMPNMNRLLNPADLGAPNGASYCSSSVITMSSGPDGRPQIYQATSSTKTGPGGIRETRKTVQDSRSGVKKMAIGHHIGERAHIIEKEQDLRSGQLEERQEFINLDEDEAEQFDNEFISRAHRGGARASQRAICGPGGAYQHPTSTLTIEPIDDDDDVQEPQHPQSHRRGLPASPTSQQQQHNNGTEQTATSTSPPPSSQCGTINTSNNLQSTYNNSNNSNSTTLRRSYLRNHHLATPRRPLRTPSSSPLATTLLSTTQKHHLQHHQSPSNHHHHHHHHHHHPYRRIQQRNGKSGNYNNNKDDNNCQQQPIVELPQDDNDDEERKTEDTKP